MGWLPKSYVSHLDVSEVTEILTVLPRKCTSEIILERCISSDNSSVDISLPLPRGYEPLPRSHHPHASVIHPAWQKIDALWKYWGSGPARQVSRIENIWLEFDTGRHDLAIPSVFFRSCPIYHDGDRASDIASWLIDDLLRGTMNIPVSVPLSSRLRRCICSLPRTSRSAFYVGIMFPRGQKGLRFVTRGLDSQSVMQYLQEIEQTNVAPDLRSLIASLAPALDCINASFDLTTDSNCPVGLECWARDDSTKSWESAIAQMARNDLCTAAMLEELYPLLRHRMNNCRVRISHVKVAFDSRSGLNAKMYLRTFPRSPPGVDPVPN